MFKYSPLLASLSSLPEGALPGWLLALPPGISFYCFEGISLLVDVAQGKISPAEPVRQYSGRVALFVSFFPHLISGPILRAAETLPQFSVEKTIRQIDWHTAFKFLILGYFLKIFVADNLADLTWQARKPLFVGSRTYLSFLIGYSAQIFADFAGYSFIALGLALLLGIKIPNNFRAPYLSVSLSDFWRRWHITLSTWLRDYLFIPLGGSRHGKLRALFNVFLVMILGGLWHGGSINFAIWGAYHGAGLVVEHLFKDKIKIPSIFSRILVFAFVTLGWSLFIHKDVQGLKEMFGALVGRSSEDSRAIFFIVIHSLPVWLLHLWWFIREKRPTFMDSEFFYAMVYTVMISLIILCPGPAHEFIYFQF